MPPFIELTHIGGGKFLVLAAWIQTVEKPLEGDFARGANAIVTLSGERRAVMETVAEIREKLSV